MSEENGNGSRQWHLDRKVPLGLLVTIIAIAAALVQWQTRTEARVDALELATRGSSVQSERIVRLETKMDAANDALTEIKAIIRGRQ